MEELNRFARPVRRSKDAVIIERSVRRHLENLIASAKRRQSIQSNRGRIRRNSPKSGLRALFAGERGTGKMLAASHVANRLETPLYQVDLGAVVNKYTGETEENLNRVFERAEASGVLLLFDEADALFGRRQEEEPTRGRHALLPVDSLLACFDAYLSLILFTADSRDSLDTAFLRRLDCVIDFPLPGNDERERTW